jgi:hypothetical protein
MVEYVSSLESAALSRMFGVIAIASEQIEYDQHTFTPM